MGSDDNLRLGVAEWGRIKRAALFRIIMRGGVELGEIARIEIEIQKIFPPPSAPPHCPCWHAWPPASEPPASRPH